MKKVMEKFLETMILNLVENKEAVEIKRVDNENSTTFEVKVAKEDMGRVIGRQGKLAKSIRTIMKSVATKEHKKVQIEFIG